MGFVNLFLFLAEIYRLFVWILKANPYLDPRLLMRRI